MLWQLLRDIAQILMAIATFLTAYLMYRSIRLMEKDRKRPVIREIIQKVVTVLIDRLDQELRACKTGRYGWSHRRKRPDHVFELRECVPPHVTPLLNDFLREHPRIKKYFDEHDIIAQKLINGLRRLDEAIATPEFFAKCRELIKENRRLREEDIPYIINHVVDGVGPELPSYTTYEFWRRHGEELLKVRERNDIRVIIEEVEINRNKLIKLSGRLKKLLEKARERYRKRYNLLVEELREQRIPTVSVS